jgi:hypothetical protein
VVDLAVPEAGLLDSVQFVIQSQGSRDWHVGGGFVTDQASAWTGVKDLISFNLIFYMQEGAGIA